MRRSAAQPLTTIGTAMLVAAAAALLGLSHPLPTSAALSGPVAEWTFDDGAGTTAGDAVGHLNGTLSGGATWTTSGVAQGSGALHFDGVDGRVTIARSVTLEPTTVTVLAWMRTSRDGVFQTILQKGSNGCEGGSWEIRQNGPYAGAWLDTAGAGTMSPFYSGAATLSDGRWHLVGFQYDAAGQTERVFVDGREDSTSFPDGLLYNLADGNALTIGSSVGTCDGVLPFQGDIDDVRVWNRALSKAEILAMLPSATTTITPAWPAGPVAAVDNASFSVAFSPIPSTLGLAHLWRVENGTPVEVTSSYLGNDGSLQFTLWNHPIGDFEMYVTYDGAGEWQPAESAHHVVSVVKAPNPVTLQANLSTVYPNQQLQLTGSASKTTASMQLWDAVDGADAVLVDTQPAVSIYGQSYNAVFTPKPSPGTHVYHVVTATNTYYLATASSTVSVVAAKRPTSLAISADGVLETSHPIAIHAAVLAQSPSEIALDATGTITLYDNGVQVGQPQTPTSGDAVWNVASMTLGTHHLSATYTGDAGYAAGSGTYDLDILANSVEAGGFSLQYTTFYPYKDGYRDTVAIRGTRYETASVAARIYSPTGKLVRTLTVASGTGAYSVAWNGRTASGTALAAGKYKVVQTLTDSANAKRIWTGYVTLSTKRLYTTTVTYSKTPSQYTKKGSSWLAWSWSIPSATVYKSIKFSVEAKVTTGEGYFGPEDFTMCGSTVWAPGCVSPQKALPSSLAWVSVTGSTKNIYAHTVRLFAWVNYTYGGSAFVYGAKVTVTYGVLK